MKGKLFERRGGKALLSSMVVAMLAVTAFAVFTAVADDKSPEGDGAVLGATGDVKWKMNLGGSGSDRFYSAIAVEGGSVAVGTSNSSAGDFGTTKGSNDAVIAMLDSSGNLKWAKRLGGSYVDAFYSVTAVAGGVIAVGSSGSLAGDFGTSKGNNDAVIAMFDLNGDLKWAKNFGGAGDDGFDSVTAVAGGVIAAGYSWSTDGGFGNAGGGDAIIAMFDLSGASKWVRNFGGSGDEGLSSVTAVAGGVIAVGGSGSGTGYFENMGDHDAIILMYDLSGNLKWAESLGGDGRDYFGSVTAVAGGVIAVGHSGSNTDHFQGIGGYDAIIAMFDLNGTLKWAKNFGGTKNDLFTSVTIAGDVVMAVGYSESTTGDFGNKGGEDAIFAMFDFSGALKGAKNLGSINNDRFTSVTASAGGAISVGFSSAAGDFSNKGGEDAIIVNFAGSDGGQGGTRSDEGGDGDMMMYIVIAVVAAVAIGLLVYLLAKRKKQ